MHNNPALTFRVVQATCMLYVICEINNNFIIYFNLLIYLTLYLIN
jgi:hypothetical protein